MSFPRQNSVPKPQSGNIATAPGCDTQKMRLGAPENELQHMSFSQHVIQPIILKNEVEMLSYNHSVLGQLQTHQGIGQSYQEGAKQSGHHPSAEPRNVNTEPFENSRQIETLHKEEREYQKVGWSKAKNDLLRIRVVNDNVYDWDKLSEQFRVNSSIIKARWHQNVYPQIISKHKIAGSRKWTLAEDSILTGAEKYFRIQKNHIHAWEQILQFLPERSTESIYGRFRRLEKKFLKKTQFLVEKQQRKDKTDVWFLGLYQYRKEVIKRIALKRINESKRKKEQELLKQIDQKLI